ncbi:MAG: Sec7 domain-containing protein [Benjaminiella poitrasii]|nr:MAG: Sec7 domain-containing protein [Benjaminiella poitrasii]
MIPARSQSLAHYTNCHNNNNKKRNVNKVARSSSLSHLYCKEQQYKHHHLPTRSTSLPPPSLPPPVPNHYDHNHHHQYHQPTLVIKPPTRSSSLHKSKVTQPNDQDITTALLEWKHKSVFKVDWASLFSPSAEIWKLNGNIFGSIEDLINDQQRDQEVERVSQLLWLEDEAFLPKKDIASYLGKLDPFCHRVLKQYMNLFDFKKLTLVESFRKLCLKLYFKAEAQAIDRILEVFAYHYWSQHVAEQKLFKSPDVVYTIIYSTMLLNTDLHLLCFGINQHDKMTMEIFCENTMSTILDNNHNIPTNQQEQLIEYLKDIYSSIENEGILLQNQATTVQESLPNKSFLKRMGSLTQRKKKETIV